MKFTVNAKAFSAAMSIAGRVIPTKTPWPVITNIYMRADGDGLTLRGTNSDITYEADVAAEVTRSGEAIIPFATLAKFFSAAKGDSLTIDVDSQKATITCGRGRIVLSADDGSAFPNYAPVDGDPVSVDPEAFVRAITFCAVAVAPSEVNYYIAGVSITEGAEGLTFWGTDAKTAHCAKIIGVGSIGGGGQIPLEAVSIISNIAEKADSLAVMVCETGWSASAGTVRAWGKVIDAKYPDLEKALASFGSVAPIAHASASDVCRAVDVAVCGSDTNSDRTRNVAVRINGAFSVRGCKPGIGTIVAGRTEIDVECIGEAAFAINADYLGAALSGIGGEVTIGIAGEAVRIEPRQSSATLPLHATISQIRASEEELADV